MPVIPRIIVAGIHSGVGKTSLTLGLVALLRRRGLRVQTYKVGPDYLDPTYLSLISGRPCYNLDSWMTSRDYVENLFLRTSADADIAVIEGVMGLFDGADSASADGSTAQIAMWLKAPILLVVNVHGMARSVAALVHGYSTFDPRIQVQGVIANHCGSEHHAQWMKESIEFSTQARLVGAVMQGSLPHLSSRHLGLISAGPMSVPLDLADKLADALAFALNMEDILRIARSAEPWERAVSSKAGMDVQCRLGIAYDEAFHFYYPDNLEALEQAGCELVKFSPLMDAELPPHLDGLYLGGGYPEEYAAELSSNSSMLEQIRKFEGKIYAECGGLMYLAEGIETVMNVRYPQVGILPSYVRMKKQRKALGYVEVTCLEPTLWGDTGATLRGHEYHYSELLTKPFWTTAYALKHRRKTEITREGFQHRNVLASYVHLHFASHPEAAAHFVRQLIRK